LEVRKEEKEHQKLEKDKNPSSHILTLGTNYHLQQNNVSRVAMMEASYHKMKAAGQC
jgi:hypothetical protein